MGNITGQFQSVDRATLQALRQANQDNKIEASEIAAIEAAARADGNFSEGEEKLIRALQQATQDGKDIRNLALKGFDPASTELSFNLSVDKNQASVQNESPESFVNNLRQLEPASRSALLTTLRNAGLNGLQQKELAQTLNRTGTPAQVESLIRALGNSSPQEIQAFSARFTQLPPPGQQAVLATTGLLMQSPPPADLREQLAQHMAPVQRMDVLKGLFEFHSLSLPVDAQESPSMAVGRTLNTVGLYLPALNPNSPGSEDATSRIRTSYMSLDPASGSVQRQYVTDMIKMARQENFQMALEVPTGTDQAALKTALMAETGIADPAEFDKVVRMHEVGRPARTANDPWEEDNKSVGNDNQTLRIPAQGADVKDALDALKIFANVNLGLKPGAPGYADEGHHTASKVGPVSNNYRGAVNERGRQDDARELAKATGMTVNEQRTYNEGGNMLSGTLPNGEPYGIIGRDGLLASTFLLESRGAPEFAPALVAQRRIALGLDNPPLVVRELNPLSPEQQQELDRTLTRLQAVNPGATADDAKDFLAKMDITKDIFAQDTGIARENLVFVSQPGFHIDMHMRMLGPGQVMVNDYDQTIRLLEDAKSRATPGSWEERELDSMIADARTKQTSMQPVMDQITRQLGDAGLGLEVIPAPGVMEGRMANGRTRHANFMNAIPGSSQGSNRQFYATNHTSLAPLRAAFEDFMRQQGVEQVYWIGTGGGEHSKSAAERSLDGDGGLDCRENHAFLQPSNPATSAYA